MTLMRHVLALGVLSASLCAQAVEISSLSIVSTRVDADRLNNGAAGATTLQAIRAAGAPYVAQISAFTLTPNTAAQGYYNWNIEGGTGIGLSPTTNQLATIPTASFFNAFDLTIDFELETTEFGFSVGDWSGGMDIEFRRAADNSLVATHRTSLFTTVATKFFQTAVEFDRVVIKADSETANWVLTDLHVPSSEPWIAFGQGCSGASGFPTLGVVSAPTLGDPFSLSLSNMDPLGGFYIMAMGSSTTTDPQLGSLPIDLAPLGAPGCQILSSVEVTLFAFHTNGAAQFNLTVPNNQALLGRQVTNQAFCNDASNPLGLIATNAGIGTVNL
jgi:hypothetical protein